MTQLNNSLGKKKDRKKKELRLSVKRHTFGEEKTGRGFITIFKYPEGGNKENADKVLFVAADDRARSNDLNL